MARPCWDYVVPPFDIDFENYTDDDLVTILGLVGGYLPPDVITALKTAVKYADETSAAGNRSSEYLP